MATIRLAGYSLESIVDGPGIRSTVFTQGCLHACPGCHNPQSHPLDGGKEINIDELIEILSNDPLIKGLTISGGEPFLQPHAVLELMEKYLKKFPTRDIIIYTGFLYEDLVKRNDETINKILSSAHILIDGPFILSKRSLALNYRGSSNQRIIDLKHSTIDKIILLDYDD